MRPPRNLAESDGGLRGVGVGEGAKEALDARVERIKACSL